MTRARLPKTNLALAPIAPIEPRAPAREDHPDGEQAAQALLDLGADHMVPRPPSTHCLMVPTDSAMQLSY